jgi:O-antigen/teichoic acid export membrane protein
MINKFGFKASKFNNDLIWNFSGFSLTALTGFAINIILIKVYGFESLGYFNLVYTMYLVGSQVATWGIHLSIQKYIPQYGKNKVHRKNLLISSLVVVFIISILFSSILILISRIPGRMMNNVLLEQGFLYSIPGIVFFAINKVYLSYLNGMRRMKEFAIFNFVRPLLMLIFLVVFIRMKADIVFLSFIFFIPEMLLFIILLIWINEAISTFRINKIIKTARMHLKFGTIAVLGNIVLDMNSKVDVFILGFFQSNTMVGVYSFASFVSDGIIQVFYVIRANINPVITDLYYHRSRKMMEKVLRISIKRMYKFIIIVGFLATLGYIMILVFLKINDYFSENAIVFLLLISGAIISGGYIPLQMVFNQIGLPKEQSRFLFLFFTANVVLNIILVPFIGIYGSAVAVFISYIFQMIYLKHRFYQITGIKI